MKGTLDIENNRCRISFRVQSSSVLSVAAGVASSRAAAAIGQRPSLGGDVRAAFTELLPSFSPTWNRAGPAPPPPSSSSWSSSAFWRPIPRPAVWVSSYTEFYRVSTELAERIVFFTDDRLERHTGTRQRSGECRKFLITILR